MHYNIQIMLFVNKYKPVTIEDFKLSKSITTTIETIIKAEHLNMLIVGGMGTGKSSMIHTIIRQYYGEYYNTQEFHQNVMFINNLHEQGISYYRSDIKTFCQTSSVINTKKKIVVIDDLANRNHLSDILIDTNIKRTETDYKALVPEKSKIFCGTEYFFLRPEFYTIQKLDIMNCNVAKQLKKILISFGGVDRDNFTLKTINALSKLHFSNNLSITVIVGKSYMWLKELKKYQNDTNMNFSLIVQSDKMALLMHDNDLMIGAGGTTNCEAMSLGLPSLLVCTADNQKRTVGIMNDCKYAIKVENNESFACEIKDKLEVLWKKPQILNEMRKNCNDVLVGSQKHINELLDQITKNI